MYKTTIGKAGNYSGETRFAVGKDTVGKNKGTAGKRELMRYLLWPMAICIAIRRFLKMARGESPSK